MHHHELIVIALGWLIPIGGALGYILALRIGSRPAALAYLDNEVKQLEKACRDKDSAIATLTAENIKLNARTNIVEAMRPLLDSLHEHENAAATRSTAMILIMEQISAKLGPDVDDRHNGITS